MNTFLPYPRYVQSAKVLDMRRLGKQRVECLQLLNSLEKGRTAAWYFHPCTQMWKGYERNLAIYGLFICDEWRKRGYKDTCFDKINNILKKYDPDYVFVGERCIDYFGCKPSPKWLGNKDFHLAMQSNLIRKDEKYYRPIFGNDVPNDLPYIWKI